MLKDFYIEYKDKIYNVVAEVDYYKDCECDGKFRDYFEIGKVTITDAEGKDVTLSLEPVLEKKITDYLSEA
jgi:hypothetical protein